MKEAHIEFLTQSCRSQLMIQSGEKCSRTTSSDAWLSDIKDSKCSTGGLTD